MKERLIKLKQLLTEDTPTTFLIRVKRSDIIKAEKLLLDRKLSRVYILNKPYYLEMLETSKEWELRVWPANTGYSGRKDGWVLYARSLLSLFESYTSLVLEDMQKQEYSNYNYVLEIEEDVQDKS